MHYDSKACVCCISEYSVCVLSQEHEAGIQTDQSNALYPMTHLMTLLVACVRLVSRGHGTHVFYSVTGAMLPWRRLATIEAHIIGGTACFKQQMRVYSKL